MSNLSQFLGGSNVDITVTEFATPGTFTFTKDSRDKFYIVQVWGGGGAGWAQVPVLAFNSGGGGGGYNERYYLPTEIGNTVSVTVGQGGPSDGIDGGDSSFGVLVAGGGGGGNAFVPGRSGRPNNLRLVSSVLELRNLSGNPFFGGTGGTTIPEYGDDYFDSIYGGGGGGLGSLGGTLPRTFGGTSVYGGNGGNGGTGAGSATNGQQPGGGGGGAPGAGAAGRGGDGLVKVTIFR
jgi:hypothetical protein